MGTDTPLAEAFVDIRQQIRSYIMGNYLFTTNDSDLRDADSLMLRGVIDSTGAMEMILFLEETFAITVAEEEMVPENLDSVDKIVDFVGRKRGAAA